MPLNPRRVHKMVKLIAIGSWGRTNVLDLEKKDEQFEGKITSFFHDRDSQTHDYVHSFTSIERARSWFSYCNDFVTVFTEEEQIEQCEMLFPEDVDVVLHRRGPAVYANLAYKPKGYDVVWSDGDDSRSMILLIRIPENGQVRCPKRFMGRVIGKKAVKINELSKKHGVKIHLVEIPD
jgi:hypothetical protein